MSEPNFELKHGPDFAEFAEALSCSTDQIFATMPRGKGVYAVLATLNPEPDMTLSAAIIQRDEDGIMQVVYGPHEQEGLVEELRDAAAGKLGPEDT